MTDLPYCPSSGRPLLDRWPAPGLAGVAAWADGLLASDNPHSGHAEPDSYAAWRDGFAAARTAHTTFQFAREFPLIDGRTDARERLSDLLWAADVPRNRIVELVGEDGP
ncbi:hypothetical protein [Inquilinus limosus]|uniref:Uncharacterized protein n=1 Tax=Inquilinus limosus MP06 TaxID=1398085 RepID=A0A0A0DFG2_9PROT|nr:hypothetical protein [Inquilinus limosus]KGM35727.1 hypothetical protein P409_02810 [Inquilinus limosus MP06]